MKINYLTDAELNNKIGTCLLTNGVISESAYNHHDYILGGHWLTSSLKDLHEECELKCFKITFTPNNKAIYGAILVSQAVYNGKRQPVTGCLQIRKEDSIEQGVFSNDLSLYYRIDEGCKPLSNIGVAVWCSRNELVLPDTNTTSSLMSTVYESYPLTVGDDWTGDHVGHYGSASDDGPHHDYGLRIIPFDYYFYIDGATVAQMNDENNYVIEEMPLPGFFAYDQKAILWKNFSKRLGSTKQPTGKGKEVNVELMDSTSMQRPVFRIDSRDTTWNYMWFRDTYYYINEVIAEYEDYIVVRGDIDRLATFKSYIKTSSAYIKRAAWATEHILIDPLNPPTDRIVMKTAESGSALGIDNNIYYYIYVSGGDGNSLYKLDKTNFDKLVKALWDGSLTDEQRVNIMSMLVKCFSMQYSISGTSVTEIKFGPTTCSNLVGERISLSQPSENVNLGNIVIPFASADWGYNSETYLDHSPYTTGLLYLPGVGVTSLDLDVVGSTRQITVFAHVAKSTGELTYKITTDSGKILSTFSGSLASDVPLSSGGYDPYAKMQATMSLIGGGVAFAAGALSGNALMALGGIGAMGASTINQMKAAEIHSMVNGAMSSNIALAIGEGRKAKAITITKVPVNTNLDHNKSMFGLPVESVGSLNNSGYVQTVGANIQMPGTADDKAAVNGLLDSGIFIE